VDVQRRSISQSTEINRPLAVSFFFNGTAVETFTPGPFFAVELDDDPNKRKFVVPVRRCHGGGHVGSDCIGGVGDSKESDGCAGLADHLRLQHVFLSVLQWVGGILHTPCLVASGGAADDDSGALAFRPKSRPLIRWFGGALLAAGIATRCYFRQGARCKVLAWSVLFFWASFFWVGRTNGSWLRRCESSLWRSFLQGVLGGLRVTEMKDRSDFSRNRCETFLHTTCAMHCSRAAGGRIFRVGTGDDWEGCECSFAGFGRWSGEWFWAPRCGTNIGMAVRIFHWVRALAGDGRGSRRQIQP